MVPAHSLGLTQHGKLGPLFETDSKPLRTMQSVQNKGSIYSNITTMISVTLTVKSTHLASRIFGNWLYRQ